MRILQVHNRYRSPGGEDSVVEAEAVLLRMAGHIVDQFIVDNSENTMRAVAGQALSMWNPFAARQVVASARSYGADLVHVHNTWFSLSTSVLRALRAAGFPVVMTLHNYRPTCINGQLLRDGAVCELCVGKHSLQGIRYRCYKGSLAASLIAAGASEVARAFDVWTKDVTLFVVMTEFARELFVAAGFPGERIRVKPHFVEDPGPRFGPPSESKSVLYVGRLAKEKGVDVLLDAWANAELENLELLVVGDGPLRAELEGRNVPGVTFPGWRTSVEVQNRMLSARALVFPSVWHETFGLALVEAMAAGCPIVASDVGGVRAVLGWPDIPWIAQPGDVESLSESLKAVNAGQQLDSRGAIQRIRYEQHYTQSHGLEMTMALYAEAMSMAEPPV